MPTSGTAHPVLGPIMHEYLSSVFPKEDENAQEWKKYRVLDAFRHLSGTAVKKETKKAFPSLFPKHRRALPLQVPEELKDNDDVRFDLKFIHRLRDRVVEYKQELAMNEQVMNEQADGDRVSPQFRDTAEALTLETPTETKAATPSKLNFLTPKGVDISALTVENYREVTGHRYRMTKDQTARKLTRADAFAESKALALTQGAG